MSTRQDFYLGDSSLDTLLSKAWHENHGKKKELLHSLKFAIDLEPKRKWLLPSLRREL